jgi:probable addiction module antidote protein
MPRSGTRTRTWDPVRYLTSDAEVLGYIEAALEDGDPSVVAAALGDVARARGMGAVAREAGLGRESLYKALSPGGNPEFATILRVIDALGFRLQPVPIARRTSKARAPKRRTVRG